MLYFAYGSNMSAPRLKARVPSAERLGVASLTAHLMVFQQQGEDGSAKCDVRYTGHSCDRVFGVLYRINPAEKALLDSYEGLGQVYADKQIEVECGGTQWHAFTYYGLQPVARLLPYPWYHAHVLRGALSADLPEDYITTIRSVAVMADPDPARELHEMSIYEQHEN